MKRKNDMNIKLKDPNLGILFNVHEIDKVTDELVKNSNGKIHKLTLRLQEAIKDFYATMQAGNKVDEKSIATRKRILEKYKHNIPSVIEYSLNENEIQEFKKEIEVKELKHELVNLKEVL